MANVREPLRERLRVPMAIAGAAALGTFLASVTGMLDRTELSLYDLRLKGNPAPLVSDYLLPIPIDDASTSRIGRWPWPRPMTAELARDLGREGARAVLLDLTYTDHVVNGAAEDAAFVETMSAAPAAVTAVLVLPLDGGDLTEEKKAALAAFDARFPFAIEGAARAIPDAPEAVTVSVPIRGLVERGPGLGVASLDTRMDKDGIARRVPLLFRRGDRWLPSLPLAMACKWHGVEPSSIAVEPGRVILRGATPPGDAPRDVVIPVDSAGRMLVRYAKNGVLASRWVSAYAMRNMLAGEDARARPHLRDRAALVYLAYSGNSDLHDTPVGLSVPGGLVVGEALNTILTGAHVRVLPWASLALIALEALALLVAVARWTSYRLGLAAGGVVFVLVTAAFALFNATAIMVPLAAPAMFAVVCGGGLVVWRTFLEDRERIDLMFALRALQNQALKERKAAIKPTTLGASTGASDAVTDALRRNVEYARFIDSLRDIESLENTYIGKHYRLLNLIDEGGMGLVFRAYDDALDRVVAIKVLTRYSAKLLKRFQTEARAVGSLQHPNVVQVFAVASEGDIPYIVMEYVNGTSLSQRIRDDGPLAIPHAAEVILQVARGLDAAHMRQIIHRDIKTSNVLLTPDGTAKVIDFGIAKFFKQVEGEGLTGEKEVVGTADYMSPEQGSGKPVDARSDVYSLGITLYRTLTGRLPFKADDTVAVLLKQMRDPLPDVRAARPDVPDELVGILLKMVEKRPEDRYQSCQELCRDLEGFLHRWRANEPSSARARP